MIDSNGGSEQEEGRSQPGKWRAVENGLAQRPSHEMDDCHHDEQNGMITCNGIAMR
jgi:hypothetical protein